MRKIDQTEFSDGVDGNVGNCLQCCLAMLLAFDLADVPHFAKMFPDNDACTVVMRNFIHHLELRSLRIRYSEGTGYWLDGVVGILAGKSPRGDWSHAVVARVRPDGYDIIHDPHPSRDGIDGEPADFEFIFPPFIPSGRYNTDLVAPTQRIQRGAFEVSVGLRGVDDE